MKVTFLLTLAMISMVQAARKPAPRPPGGNRAAASPTLPSLSPQQSNPPDPGDAFQPRYQSGILSNIGIGAPTAIAYYHPGDTMTFTIRADMFLPESNTGAEIVDFNNNTIAPVIPTFPMLNSTTLTTTVPLPTQATPGTYWLRFQQTYSNTFAHGMRTQSMEVEMVVLPASSPIPPAAVTTTVNALGLTLTTPPAITAAASAPGASSLPVSGAATATGSGVPTAGNGTNSTGAVPTHTAGAMGSFDAFGVVVAVVLGFVGVLAAL